MLDLPRKPIKNDTVLLGSIDNRTDLVRLTPALGPLPLPGNNLSVTVICELLHTNPASGNDVELAPSEQFS
jgi:hypothetical protein